MLRICQLLQADADSSRMIRDHLLQFRPLSVDLDETGADGVRLTNSVNTPACELSFAGQIEQTVFETCGSQIGDENLHTTTFPAVHGPRWRKSSGPQFS
jgi:hypothetical protein